MYFGLYELSSVPLGPRLSSVHALVCRKHRTGHIGLFSSLISSCKPRQGSGQKLRAADRVSVRLIHLLMMHLKHITVQHGAPADPFMHQVPII